MTDDKKLCKHQNHDKSCKKEKKDNVSSSSKRIVFDTSQPIGNGHAATFVELKKGCVVRVGILLTEGAFENLPAANPCTHFYRSVVPFPCEAQKFGFIFGTLDWTPQGHPELGPRFTVPHFDIHFYMIPQLEVESILPDPRFATSIPSITVGGGQHAGASTNTQQVETNGIVVHPVTTVCAVHPICNPTCPCKQQQQEHQTAANITVDPCATFSPLDPRTLPAPEFRIPPGFVDPRAILPPNAPIPAVPRMGIHYGRIEEIVNATDPFQQLLGIGVWNRRVIFIEPMITREAFELHRCIGPYRENLCPPEVLPDGLKQWPTSYEYGFSDDLDAYAVVLNFEKRKSQ